MAQKSEVNTAEIEWGPPDDREPDGQRSRETDEGGAQQEPRRFKKRAVGKMGILILLLTTGTFFLLSGGAVAHTSFSAGDVAVTSNSGNLQSLTVAPSGDIHYQGFEQSASEVIITTEVKEPDGNWTEIGNKSTSASGLEGTLNYSFSTIDVLANSAWDSSDFEAADGKNKSTDVKIRVTATFVGAGADDGSTDVTTTASATFTVTVENVAAGSNVGGKGNTNGSAPGRS